MGELSCPEWPPMTISNAYVGRERCGNMKIHADFQDLIHVKKYLEHFIQNFYIDYMLKIKV